ncbi:MAG: hypothetical protein RSE19_03850, partial [Myroides sp.]
MTIKQCDSTIQQLNRSCRDSYRDHRIIGSTSNIKHLASNIKHQTSNIKHQTSNIKHQTSNIK